MTSEIDKYAVSTYAVNFPSPDFIRGDVKLIKNSDIPEFDICLAGFPCQAFSSAGKRAGFSDPRGTLFNEIIRICDFRKPKVIFCENVAVLVKHNKGNTFNTIINAFEKIGYKVFHHILNSKDFGVPQNRLRVYIVAFRKDIAPDEFNFPKGDKTSATCLRDIRQFNVPAKYWISNKYTDKIIIAENINTKEQFGLQLVNSPIKREIDDLCQRIQRKLNDESLSIQEATHRTIHGAITF